MKTSLLKNLMTRWAGGAAVVLVMLGGIASQPAQAQVAATKHNLGSGGTGVNKFDGTGEICVFCHTPHGADTSAAVPLWNRVMASPATYTTYNSLGTSSLDGATAPVGSVSLACLSCHDGAQAMNVMINAPGSGNYSATGFTLAGAWTGANQTAGKISAGLITNIGTDLKNDHPIGIQYGGGPKAATIPAAPTDYTKTLFNDPDFNDAKSASLNGTQVWWVETASSGAGRQKTDMQLYTRTETAYAAAGAGTIASTVPQPYVECASCHDPHTNVNPTFLRISNNGSAVCLACHIK
ncbi:cytochrome c3 family protein [Rhodoferax sp.]|uniref:cytochrome c3 family protein n=1 Tax=Rhodoferax sp. TaxID=50421 RepID=UPI0027582608|nr:cytochrome c3 family protein [Rhodoferax sp.]